MSAITDPCCGFLVVCMHSWLPAVSARLVFTVRLCPILQLWRKIREKKPRGLVLSGELFSIHDAGSLRFDTALFQDIPVLGSSVGGMHLLARLLGGKISSGEKKGVPEMYSLTLLRSDLIFKGLPGEISIQTGDQE